MDYSLQDYTAVAAHSPIPPWAMSASLLYVGLLAPATIAAKEGSLGGSYLFSRSAALVKPTKKTCLLFSAANALGGWIIFDGDVNNGAGFTFAWSMLYMVVNGRPSIRSFLKGRVSPMALSLLALGNTGIYGKQFFWPAKAPA